MTPEQDILQEFIRCLLSAAANTALYSNSHPQVKKLIDAAYTSAANLFNNTPSITIICAEGELILNGQPQENSLFLNRFSDILTRSNISHLTLNAGLSHDEISTLVTVLAAQKDMVNVPATPHIKAGQVELRTGQPGAQMFPETSGKLSETLTLSDMPVKELHRFMEIYETVKQRRQLKINGISEIVSGFVDAFQQQGDALLTMASLRNADEYTFTHSTNVCILTIAQAMALGIEGQLLRDFGIAAMLHDIGKLFIPEEIVTKKGALTSEEFDIMRNHPILGARHLLNTPGVPRLAITVAFEHHLKFNLSGYPRVASTWKPNLCSQMTMIADFFDALRTRRSYREPVEMKAIAAMMLEMSGKDFHPVLTNNFLIILSRLIPA